MTSFYVELKIEQRVRGILIKGGTKKFSKVYIRWHQNEQVDKASFDIKEIIIPTSGPVIFFCIARFMIIRVNEVKLNE